MKKLMFYLILIILTISSMEIILASNSKIDAEIENGDQLDITLCPDKETTIKVTAKNLSENLSANVYFSTENSWIIIKNPGPYLVPPNQSITIDAIVSSKDLMPGDYLGYIKARFEWIVTPPSPPVPPSEKILTIKLKVLLPQFSITPKEISITILPFSEKTFYFSVKNGLCENLITIFSTKEYSEGKLVGAIFKKTLSLMPNEYTMFPIKIKTENFISDKEIIEINFNTKFVTYFGSSASQSIRIIVNSSPKITISGVVEDLNEKERYMRILSEDDKRYRVILRDEDIGKYKIGDYINLTGYYDGENIFPIEIIKPECGVFISDPENITFCPTCPEITYGGELYNKENVKSVKVKVKNSGKVNIKVSSSIELEWENKPDDVKIETKIEPSSLSLNPNEEKEFTITVEVKENPRKMNAYFTYKLKFSIFPSPPCPKEIEKEFKVTICPTIRDISGVLKFINSENKECILKGAKVLLFLNYEPKCKVDDLFKLYEGDFRDVIKSSQPNYSVHESFNEGLPNKKYYLETYTDEKGEFKFLFNDNDCKYDYKIYVLFETKEFKLTYFDCKNIFFLKVNIKNEDKPCPAIVNKREIVIGKDSDIEYPKDFTFDPKDMAQIFCHIDEAFSIFRNEKCDGNDMINKTMLPINVCAYSNENRTFYRYTEKKINIERNDSNSTSFDRPMNREWHEFGHFLHNSLVGDTTYKDTLTGRRRNHEGIMNDTTNDSFMEGLAEATSILILRLSKLKGTCCSDLSSQNNGTYKWGNAISDLENEKFKSDTAVYEYFDDAGKCKQLDKSKIICEGGKLVYKEGGKTFPVIVSESREELAVAGLLIDLLDDGSWYNGNDDDGFSFPNWQDLFCLIKNKSIKSIKELYDALREKFTDSSSRDKIDKIFVDHGFFQDKNFNGIRDSNEKIGVTFRCEHEYRWYDGGWNKETRNKIDERPNQPLIPQANITPYLFDKDGNKIENGILVVEVLSFDGKVNFSYEREAKSGEPFYVYIVPNGDEILRIYMKDSKEKPLIITEGELWNSVLNDKPTIVEHNFKMSEEEVQPEISLEKEIFDFGSLLEGERSSLTYSFWNSGRGKLSLLISSLNNWISVEPKTFEGNVGFITVNIDTTNLKSGINEGKIKIISNQFEKEIKVKVDVIKKIKKTVIELFIGNKEAYINGELYILDSEPYIKPPGRTMVPLRFISEGLGATVDYSPKVGKVEEVYIYYKNKKITLFIGKKEALIDDKEIILDAEAEITKGRTFVPIRFIAETFGAKVDWEASTKKVTITLEE